MAISNAYYAVNMDNAAVWYGTDTIANATQLQIAWAGYVQNYYGSFQYNSNGLAGGVVTSTDYFENGRKIYDITGGNYSALTVASYLDSGNITGLFSYVFAGSDTFNGSNESDRLNGFTGNDALRGNAGHDTLTGGAGNDTIDGGTGSDTAIFSSSRAAYSISMGADGLPTRVASSTETDTLANVERLRFSDKMLAFDINANAGQAYRLYQAAFDRTPDQAGLSFWVRVLDASALNLEQVSGEFLRSAEFTSLYGASASNASLVGLLYRNVLNREADAGGQAYWLSQLDAGMQREQLLINFSESAENKANVIGVIQNGITLDLV